MSKKNLLLCLDAFGTIFSPKRPIAEQYAEVARTFGIESDAKDVGASFKKAFKEESKTHPNYGRAVGMGAEKWWTNVISNTFTPLTTSPLPTSLASTLLTHFSTSAAYTLHPDVKRYLLSLRSSPSRQPTTSDPATSTSTSPTESPGRLVIGIITNSDDRVPSILTSLGLRVGSLRHGSTIEATNLKDGSGGEADHDIDFTIMSYDVGAEKPDPVIFDAATGLLRRMLCAERGCSSTTKPEDVDVTLDDWGLVYIGDEAGKDAKGAVAAGWEAVIVRREWDGSGEEEGVSYMVKGGEGLVMDVISDFGALRNLRGKWPLVCG